MDWEDADEAGHERDSTLQVEMAECVETKIVTTTTTTKRSYPPLLVRQPRLLQELDVKEYPLASKRTPRELANFSYEVDGKVMDFHEEDATRDGSEVGGPQPSKLQPWCGKLTLTSTSGSGYAYLLPPTHNYLATVTYTEPTLKAKLNPPTKRSYTVEPTFRQNRPQGLVVESRQ